MAQKQVTSESQMGALHLKVAKVFGITLDQMIEKLENKEDAEFALNPQLLALVVKFLNDNKIYSVAEEDAKDSALSQKLAEIKAHRGKMKLVKEA